MNDSSRLSRAMAKGVTLLTSLFLAFTLALAFTPPYAFADDQIKADVYTDNCTVIGTYEFLDEIDIYYVALDDYADYVVFPELAEAMAIEDSMLTSPYTYSYLFYETNEAIIRSDALVTFDALVDDDNVALNSAAYSKDFSNAYGFLFMDGDYEESWLFIVQVPEAPGPTGSTFSSSVGTIGEVEPDGYSYTDWDGTAYNVDQYTLTVPMGTTSIELNFDGDILAYGYDMAGEYVNSGSDDPDYYIDGSTTATFTADANGLFPDYIRIQTPYGDSWNSTTLYGIKIVYSYTFTASVDGKVIDEILFTPEDYSYYDYMTGKTVKVASFTLTIPEETETVDLVFSDNVLVYNYTKDGVYLGGFYVDFETGGTTASVMVDYGDSITAADGEFDCIQVQSPYDASWNSTLFYVITFDDGSEDDPDGPDDPSDKDYDLDAIKQAAGEKLSDTLDQNGSIYGQEWLVLDVARDGEEVSDEYIDSVIETLEANDGVIHTSVGDYTNYAKTILAVTAAGYDATALKGYDLTEALADTDAVTKQGINGAAYALLALDSHDYADPGDGTRDALIDFILDEEIDGGGWAWSGSIPDSDMTAIVIQALAPYAESNTNVAAAVNRGIELLSDMQQDSGGFASEAGDGGVENSNSVAQVIIALTAVGIDPTSDDRFIKDGNSVVDALASYALDNGGFGYTNNTTYNALSTQQGHYALIALYRFLDDENALYDMTDVDLKGVYDAADIQDADDTGVTTEGTVILPSGEEDPVLIIEKIEGYDPDYVASQFKLSADGELVGFYSITLLQNGEEIHNGFGSIAITFPIDALHNGKTATLHHLHADGSLTSETATVANGRVTFEFTDLSTVALEVAEATENPDQGNTPAESNEGTSSSTIAADQTPNTGDSMLPIVVPACAAFASLLIALVAWRRKETIR